MRLFYDFEHDEFLTENMLKSFFNCLSDSEKEEYNNNVQDYIECCQAYNNGCCITIEQYEKELKKAIKSTEIDDFSIHDIVNKVLMLKDLYEFKEKHSC